MEIANIALALLAAILVGRELQHRRRKAPTTTPAPAPAPEIVHNDSYRMSKVEVLHLAEMVGFPDSAIAAAVALAESGGRPRALGDNGLSVGLWQVYLPMHPGYTREELFDPLKNAHAALRISEHGRNWRPWAAFNNGKYKQFL